MRVGCARPRRRGRRDRPIGCLQLKCIVQHITHTVQQATVQRAACCSQLRPYNRHAAGARPMRVDLEWPGNPLLATVQLATCKRARVQRATRRRRISSGRRIGSLQARGWSSIHNCTHCPHACNMRRDPPAHTRASTVARCMWLCVERMRCRLQRWKWIALSVTTLEVDWVVSYNVPDTDRATEMQRLGLDPTRRTGPH